VAGLRAPGGTFTQASLLPTRWMEPARRQERDIRARFGQVELSPPVWRTLPPAQVLVARSPRTAPR
jgi:hypothetical protein